MRQKFSYTLGPGVGRRANLGLLVLQTDETLEYDLRRLLPDEGVGLYTSRVANATHVTSETLAEMENTLPAAAALLPRAINFDVVGYGCTSGSAVIGDARIADLVKSNCAASVVTTPITALLAACRKLNLSRLAFLSPYVEEVSAKLRKVLADAGISSPHFGDFEEMNDSRVARIDAQSVTAAAVELYRRGDADAVFISCTNLQTLDIISTIEEECDCFVLSSNLVLIWHMLEQAGLTAKTPLARLLRAPPKAV